MAVKFLVPDALKGVNADDDYLKTVNKYGDTTEPTPHVKACLEYGVKATQFTNGNPKSLLEALKKGPVGVGFLHHGPPSAPRGGGHWVLLIGATETRGIFHDPYGELDNVNGGYAEIGSGGKAVAYSWKNWLPRWASASIGPGWYTTFEKIAAPVPSQQPIPGVPIPLSKATLAHIWECRPEQITDAEIQDLNLGLAQFGITTKPNLRHFLSQTAHESGGGKWLEELASGAAYEGRPDLGNVMPGDGVKFKGAGLLQVTGRFNYAKMSEAFKDVAILERGCPYVAAKYPISSACWWWANIGKLTNERVDKMSVEAVTRVVNGGQNGLADRKRYYRKVQDVI
jgi:predicted chitinase